MSCPALIQGSARPRGDLVPHIPQLLIEKMLHPLMQNFDWRAHGPDYSASNDSLRQFQMMKAKQVDTFIEIEQTLRDIVQLEEILVTAVNVVDGYTCFVSLLVERLAEARPNVQQR